MFPVLVLFRSLHGETVVALLPAAAAAATVAAEAPTSCPPRASSPKTERSQCLSSHSTVGSCSPARTSSSHSGHLGWMLGVPDRTASGAG